MKQKGSDNNLSSFDPAHSAANLAAENQEKLLQTLTIQKDHDGKSKLLGIEVSDDIAIVVNPLLNIITGPASTFLSNEAYKKATKLAAQFFESSEKGHRFSKGVEAGVRWGVLLLNPISQFIAANSHYAMERRALYKELKPTVDALGINYSHNLIIREAHDRLNENWKGDIKLTIPDILALSPHIIVAAGEQKKLWKQRDAEFESGVYDQHYKSTTPQTKTVSPADKKLVAREELEKSLATRRKKFISSRINNSDYDYLGHNDDARRKALAKEFDNVYATPEREALNKPQTPVTDNRENADAWWSNSRLAVSSSAAGLGQVIKGKMLKAHDEREAQPTALSLIKHLQEEIAPYFVDGNVNKPDLSRMRVSISKDGKTRDVSLKDYVVEIFQQVERFHNKTEFAAGLLEQLRESVDPIIQHLADGTLDASAIIKLAGEDMVVAHKGGKRVFKSQKQVEDAICSLTGRSSVCDLSEKEFLAAFPVPDAIKNLIRKNTESLNGESRTLFISLLPSEVAEHMGIPKDQLLNIRSQGHELIYDAMVFAVEDLAKKDEKTLTTLGLSKEQITAINNLHQEIEQGNIDAIKVAVDGKDKTVTNAVLTASLSEQLEQKDGAGYWTKRLAESKTAREKLNEARASLQQNDEKERVDEASEEAKPHHAEHVKKHGHKEGHKKKHHREHDDADVEMKHDALSKASAIDQARRLKEMAQSDESRAGLER